MARIQKPHVPLSVRLEADANRYVSGCMSLQEWRCLHGTLEPRDFTSFKLPAWGEESPSLPPGPEPRRSLHVDAGGASAVDRQHSGAVEPIWSPTKANDS